jgi:hypothetical protein
MEILLEPSHNSSMAKASICLVYLSYTPFGTGYLNDFIASYKARVPGIEHELIILFNGETKDVDIQPFIKILSESEVNFKYLISPEKFDIVSYFYVAQVLKTDYIAFINTYSVILHDNWLLYLYQNVTKKDVGVVGASGGWGDFGHNDEYYGNIKSILRFKINPTLIKKSIFFRFNFYPQVPPHIRTNAFMIRRELFLALKYPKVKPLILNFFIDFSKSKLRSLCFEHGREGFTSQLVDKGLKAILVDRFGKGFEMPNWPNSKTFWHFEQENLLVSDNQTRKYQEADEETKKRLTYAAWGF